MNPETHTATIPARASDGTERIVTLTRDPKTGRISIIAEVCLCVLTYDRHQLLLAIRTLAEEGNAERGVRNAEIPKLRAALEAFEANTDTVVLTRDLRDDVIDFAETLVEAIERLEASLDPGPH